MQTPLAKTSTSKSCPFLQSFSPTELTTRLAQSAHHSSHLRPFWLHNAASTHSDDNNNPHKNGTAQHSNAQNSAAQNCLGILPKVSWQLEAKDHTNSNPNIVTPLVLKTHNRPALADLLVQVTSPSSNTQHSKTNSGAFWHPDLSTTCATPCTLDAFIHTLIDYQTAKHPQKAPSTPGFANQSTNSPVFFTEGLLGFIGYDVAAQALNPSIRIQTHQPCAYFGHYDIYLTAQPLSAQVSESSSQRISYSHTSASHTSASHTTTQWRWTLHTTSPSASQHIEQIYQALYALIQSQQPVIHSANPEVAHDGLAATPLQLTPVWSKHDYQKAFERTQHYLHAGDCYQVNLTQAWQAQLNPLGTLDTSTQAARLVTHLSHLHASSHAPYAGYLSLGMFELLSCSPELFFTFRPHLCEQTLNQAPDSTSSKNRDSHPPAQPSSYVPSIHIVTKPIKGTRPRGHDKTTDDALRQQLANSEKDIAENVMIVDLLRNDLGKYAQIGSVKTPKRFAIESFSNVHHMVSTIEATLKPEQHPLTVLFGSLPAGSITGTPKKRAVEIIHELEAQPRGAYCGTMGFLNFDGSGQWNVLIRTLQANRTAQVSLWAGGGITVASQADAEYQECWDKVSHLLHILAGDFL